MDEVEERDNGHSSHVSVDLDELHDSAYITNAIREGEQVRVYREDEYDSFSEGEGDDKNGIKDEDVVGGEHEQAYVGDAGYRIRELGQATVNHKWPPLRTPDSIKGSGEEDDPLDLISVHSRDSEDGDVDMVDRLL